MTRGFRGDVADYYQRYRRGYPPAVFDTLTTAFTLTDQDIAIDLGCGTGQLTIPLATRVRATIGIDIEPDMLAHARTAAIHTTASGASDTSTAASASARNVPGNAHTSVHSAAFASGAIAATHTADSGNAHIADSGSDHTGEQPITWLLGADTDLPNLTALLGKHSVGVITIGQALHWMDHDTLFRNARPLLRAGGGVAVISNGTPLWLQDNSWSHALRTFLENWRGQPLTATCGTDTATQDRYRASLTNAGYTVRTAHVDYSSTLTAEEIIGGVYSALSPEQLPADRSTFADSITRALGTGPFPEQVRVTMLLGTAA